MGRTLFVDAIDPTLGELIFEQLTKSDAAMRVAQLRALGGALSRVPSDATAYAHRTKPILVNVAVFYTDDADGTVRHAWVAEFARALQPNDDDA